MKTRNFLGAFTIIVCLLVATAPTHVLAASASAWSDIDWSSITFNFNGNGSLLNDRTGTNAKAGVITDHDTANGIAPIESYAEVDANNFWGWGLSDATDLYADAFSQDHSGVSYGDAGYYGQYTATTAGTLTVSFNYKLAYDVATGAGEHAYGDAGSYLTLGDFSDSDSRSIEAFNGMDFQDETPWYTMSLSTDLLAGQTVDFAAYTTAQAETCPVPVPGAIWLLGSALAGLAGIHRRS